MAEKQGKRDTDFSDFQSPHEASVDRLVQAVDRAYHRPLLMMWRAFLQGVSTAFGITVGYLIIFTLLFYIFQSLGGTDRFLTPTLQKVANSILPAELRSSPTPSPSPSPTPVP